MKGKKKEILKEKENKDLLPQIATPLQPTTANATLSLTSTTHFLPLLGLEF
jgi:hypothetical protein